MQRGFAGTGLTFLRVSHNPRLCDAGLVHLAGALPPTLDTLQLTNVGCGDEGMVALAKGLPTLPGLVELAVQSNPDVGEAGFTALGAALPALPKLVRLHCHACTGMGCAGLAGLAKGLPEAGALEDLDVSQCGIGPGGVKVLTPLVEEVPALFGFRFAGPCAQSQAGPTATTQTAALDLFTAQFRDCQSSADRDAQPS